jgi:hypothetical protein
MKMPGRSEAQIYAPERLSLFLPSGITGDSQMTYSTSQKEKCPQLAAEGIQSCAEKRGLADRRIFPKEDRSLSPAPTDAIAIARMNDRRAVANLPKDDPRRTPSLPKLPWQRKTEVAS